jgi:hypothetical protein
MKKIIKYGCFGILGFGLILLISLLILFKQAFGPTNEIVEIKQEIGGKLICKSEYNADMASWFYDIYFEYQSENGNLSKIGSGEYYGRDWNKDEQIIKIGNWAILKTGSEFSADKLLIGKIGENKWREFKISPTEIEKDSLWVSKKIFVKQNWRPQESFVKEMGENKINVEYLYRIGETVEEQETRLITYEFDETIGIPKMMKIELKK